MVPRIRLGPDGPELSRLAYGTWRLLNDGDRPTPHALVERLNHCADLGITTIDTAEIYGGYRVEELLGTALALDSTLRQRLQIVTKAGIYVPNAWHPERTVAAYDASGARLVKSAEKSLRFLGVERLDLFLVHRPDWRTPAADTAEGLERLVRDGKVAAVGVSNYDVHQFDTLQACLSVPLVTNQVEFSLLHVAPIHDGTAAQCERRGIPLMAWSPLGQGRLLDPADPAGARLQELAATLAPRHGNATVDQLALAWLLAHPSRPIPVIGTSKRERITRAAEAAALTLDRNDWYALWTAAQGRRIP